MKNTSKQLVLGGQLKPEARLGLAISEFAQSLQGGRRDEFRLMQTVTNKPLSGQDVVRVTEEINRDGARRHRSWRPYLAIRLGGVLSRLQMFASIGDVMIGGSQNLIATGVWSAVRLSLMTATNYFNYFERLSTLFLKLGKSWSLHEDYAQLFPRSAMLQTYLCEYLIVLVRLCRTVVVFAQKNYASQIVSSLGSSFDNEFGPFQMEMDQWGTLIQQKAQYLFTKSTLHSEAMAVERSVSLSKLISGEATKEKIRSFKHRMRKRLYPEQSQNDTTWRRHRRKGTCKWISEAAPYQSWKSMQVSSTLCVSGKLGSGKTVAMANLIAQMNEEQLCAGAFFFCTFKDQTSLKAANILGGILSQFLDGLETNDINWGAVARKYDAKLSSISSPHDIVETVLPILPTTKKYVVALDGLEDCSDEDVNDVMLGLTRLMEARIILLSYSARSESRFQQLARHRLGASFTISLDEQQHSEEIEEFIQGELERRNASRQLSPQLQELVKRQLVVGSQGMYLWVSLQLDAIFPSDSKTIITDELIHGLIIHLPKDLPEAFERALEGITDKRYNGNIHKLVMAAESAFTLDQLRIALAITPGETIWHPSKVPRDGSQLMSLCGGSLLEVDEEDDKIRFIHHSVIQHLLSPATIPTTSCYHFSLEDCHNFMGSILVTYLNFPVFESRMVLSKKIRADKLVGEAMETVAGQDHPVIGRMIQHFRSKNRGKPYEFDISRLALEAQAFTPGQDDDLDLECLSKYARANWLLHTRFFTKGDVTLSGSWDLWWRLVRGLVSSAAPPFNIAEKSGHNEAIYWAINNRNGSLFLQLMTSAECDKLDYVSLRSLIDYLSLNWRIQNEWLGDIAAQYCDSFSSKYFDYSRISTIPQKFVQLYNLGADLTKQHHVTEKTPLEILITGLPNTNRMDINTIHSAIKTLLRFPKVKASLQYEWVLKALFKLIELDVGHATEHTKGTVEILLSFLPNPQISLGGVSVLGQAVLRGSDSLIELLLAAGADPVSSIIHNKSAIQLAVEERHSTALKSIITHHPDAINSRTRDGIPLICLGIKMDVGWMSELLDIGADPNTGPFNYSWGGSLILPTYPFQMALLQQSPRMCLELLIHGAKLNGRPTNPEEVKLLNLQDEYGKTMLHYIAGYRIAMEYTKPLLDAGADPNVRDIDGETPLFSAIWTAAPIDLVIQPLLAAKADPNIRSLVHPETSILKVAYGHGTAGGYGKKVTQMLEDAGAKFGSYQEEGI